MGKLTYEWQAVDYILKMFGYKISLARRAYADFVAKGVALGRRPGLVGGGLIRSVGGWSAIKALRSKSSRVMGDERILGSSDFVEAVLKYADEAYETRTFAIAKGVDLNYILSTVSDYFGIEREYIKGTGKQPKVSLARAIVCLLAVDKLKLSSREVARRLGLTPSAVSKALVRAKYDTQSEAIWKEIMKSQS
jgi:putative transposase